MDKRVLRDIQQRGELVGSYIRNGCKTEGVGTGMSELARMIEFRGLPPRGTGNDISNLSAIIAMQQYERTDQPRIAETIDALRACSEVNEQAALIWLHHYSADGTAMDKARSLNIARATYFQHISRAEHMLAIRLAG